MARTNIMAIGISLGFVFLISSLLLLPVSIEASEISCQSLEEKVKTLFNEVYVLSERGINVSSAVEELDKGVKALNQGQCNKAETYLQSAEDKINALRENADTVILQKNIIKWATVGILAAIPIVTYLLLPRIYMGLWFRYRRKWKVRKYEV